MTRSQAVKLDVCGVTAVVAVIDGKWKTSLLWLLEAGPQRPAEIRRRLTGLSEKVLTQALREMESDGLVHREVHDVLPLKTVYSLTDFGRRLSVALGPVSDLGHERLDRLAAERAEQAGRTGQVESSAS
ncbi:helix-turn-helix domain-containing protein [Kitasatospora purpeofusca]|uniref:winged helix-turn-helix transcriptional regulator n=1 Tax=Kitasatospora purpeofusca TaxID=67352 RepID=UPI0030F2AE18